MARQQNHVIYMTNNTEFWAMDLAQDVWQFFSLDVIVTCKISFTIGSWRETAGKITSKVTLSTKARN